MQVVLGNSFANIRSRCLFCASTTGRQKWIPVNARHPFVISSRNDLPLKLPCKLRLHHLSGKESQNLLGLHAAYRITVQASHSQNLFSLFSPICRPFQPDRGRTAVTPRTRKYLELSSRKLQPCCGGSRHRFLRTEHTTRSSPA